MINCGKQKEKNKEKLIKGEIMKKNNKKTIKIC